MKQLFTDSGSTCISKKNDYLKKKKNMETPKDYFNSKY